MRSRCVRLVLTLAALTSGCAVVLADNKAPDSTADAELLEFLGSVDSGADSQTAAQAAADDEGWIDYLSQTDIDGVAKTADPGGPARAKQVATGTPPPAAGDKKDE